MVDQSLTLKEYPIDPNAETVPVISKREEGELRLGGAIIAPVFFYMSDLHLDDKIRAEGANTDDISLVKFIDQTVEWIYRETFESSSGNNICSELGRTVLIGGDVSFDPHIVEIFLSKCTELFEKTKIVYILGNHELWNYTNGQLNPQKYSVEEIVDLYREICYDTGVIFLHNELLCLGHGPIAIITEDKLLTLSSTELITMTAPYVAFILGGLGFSGKNDEFNATHGIYRNTLAERESDQMQSERFDKLYEKLLNTFSTDPRFIVFTHNPPRDWHRGGLNHNWTFIHGHTHRNTLKTKDPDTIIANNQWGYQDICYKM